MIEPDIMTLTLTGDPDELIFFIANLGGDETDCESVKSIGFGSGSDAEEVPEEL